MAERTFLELWEEAYCGYLKLCQTAHCPLTKDQLARLAAFEAHHARQ